VTFVLNWMSLRRLKRSATWLAYFRISGWAAKPAIEFSVSDHIGAVAVSSERGLVFGANWDTVKVYVWDFTGALQRTLRDDELKARGLGVDAAGARAGIAVQDWKIVGDRLFAAGLFKTPESTTVPPASRFCEFERFLERDLRSLRVTLPQQNGTELAREAMAVAGGSVYFLPEDLGASNRVFHLSIAKLTRTTAGRRF